MARSKTSHRIVAATIALSVAAAGCGGGDGTTGTDPTTSSTAPPETAAPSTTVATTPAPDTPAPATEVAPGLDSHDPACIPGDWIADTLSLQQWYSGFMTGAAEVEAVIGEMLFSFDAETFIIGTTSLQILLRVDGTPSVAKLEGQSAGTYVATADGAMTTGVELNDFRMSAAVAGIEVDMTSSGLPLDEMLAFTTFECADGTLTLETAAGGSQSSTFLMLNAA